MQDAFNTQYRLDRGRHGARRQHPRHRPPRPGLVTTLAAR